MTKTMMLYLAGLLLAVLVTGCATVEQQRQQLLTGLVVDHESGNSLADVHLAIVYRATSSAIKSSECKVIFTKTNPNGYFGVPGDFTVDTLSSVELTLYKRGYIFIVVNETEPSWPVAIEDNTMNVQVNQIQQNVPLPTIRMYKNNMSPQLRHNYIGSLLKRGTACVREKQQTVFVEKLEEEINDLSALGVTLANALDNQWYGPGVDGLQRKATAGSSSSKPHSRVVLKTNSGIASKTKVLKSEPVISDGKQAREDRRRARRKKLDEILMKSRQ